MQQMSMLSTSRTSMLALFIKSLRTRKAIESPWNIESRRRLHRKPPSATAHRRAQSIESLRTMNSSKVPWTNECMHPCSVKIRGTLYPVHALLFYVPCTATFVFRPMSRPLVWGGCEYRRPSRFSRFVFTSRFVFFRGVIRVISFVSCMVESDWFVSEYPIVRVAISPLASSPTRSF